MNPILFLENVPKITIKSEINDHCKTYGAKRVENDSKWYQKTRGGKPANVYSFWGYKCAEFAASQFLTESYNFPNKMPDTEIYQKNQKNWNADLLYDDINFCNKQYNQLRVHVKSTSKKAISDGYPESFMFQLSNRSGMGGMDKILTEGDENDLIVMVYNPYSDVVEGDVEFHIRGMVPWTYAKKYLENPVAPSLIGKKICVYTETLNKSLTSQKAF